MVEAEFSLYTGKERARQVSSNGVGGALKFKADMLRSQGLVAENLSQQRRDLCDLLQRMSCSVCEQG